MVFVVVYDGEPLNEYDGDRVTLIVGVSVVVGDNDIDAELECDGDGDADSVELDDMLVETVDEGEYEAVGDEDGDNEVDGVYDAVGDEDICRKRPSRQQSKSHPTRRSEVPET